MISITEIRYSKPCQRENLEVKNIDVVSARPQSGA